MEPFDCAFATLSRPSTSANKQVARQVTSTGPNEKISCEVSVPLPRRASSPQSRVSGTSATYREAVPLKSNGQIASR